MRKIKKITVYLQAIGTKNAEMTQQKRPNKTTMNSKTIATFLFAVLSVTASAQEAQQDFTSKIVNPGFEQDLSIGWISRGMGRMDNTEATADKRGTLY